MRATTFAIPTRSDTRFCKRFSPLAGGEACFLTATPRNKSAWDVYFQIKLFHQDDKTDLPVDPADLKQYFKLIDEGQKKLPDLAGAHSHSPHAEPHPALVRVRFRHAPAR